MIALKNYCTKKPTSQISVRILTSNDKSIVEGTLKNITYKYIEKKVVIVHERQECIL